MKQLLFIIPLITLLSGCFDEYKPEHLVCKTNKDRVIFDKIIYGVSIWEAGEYRYREEPDSRYLNYLTIKSGYCELGYVDDEN